MSGFGEIQAAARPIVRAPNRVKHLLQRVRRLLEGSARRDLGDPDASDGAIRPGVIAVGLGIETMTAPFDVVLAGPRAVDALAAAASPCPPVRAYAPAPPPKVRRNGAGLGRALRLRVARRDRTTEAPAAVAVSTPVELRTPGAVSVAISAYAPTIRRPIARLPGRVASGRFCIGSRAMPMRARLGSASSESLRQRMPVQRRKVSALNESEFIREKRALCAAAGLDENDLRWIGLFRMVPLAAAESVEVDEQRGMLCVTVKAASDKRLRRQAPMVVVDLAMGRSRSTGAVVRTALNVRSADAGSRAGTV